MATWRAWGAAIALISAGCGPQAGGSAVTPAAGKAPTATAPTATAPTSAPRRAPTGPTKRAVRRVADPLFPKPVRGWKSVVTQAERARIDTLAVGYVQFLGQAKTPRQSVRELARLFGASASLPAKRHRAAPGTRYVIKGPAGKTAAFVRVGRKPVEQGLRIIVASVDAPRIDLKQQPLYDKAGLAMLDTVLYGSIHLESWLVHPLALHVHVSRPGARDGDADIVVGETPADPVLMIPDLLPHLSGKVQRRRIVDSAERMDAVGASSRRALLAYLGKHGVDERAFAAAEASLVPAGGAHFIGVDRGLIAGYGQSHRALAFAAVRALSTSAVPERTAMVIVVDKAEVGYTGSSGLGFVRRAINRVIANLAGEEADALTTRRAYARSAALIGERRGGTRNKGLVLNPRGDDALPSAHRRLIDVLDRAKAQYQIATASNWSSATRRLGQLDMDVADVGIPSTGHGSPRELISAFDLHHAARACAAWLVSQ